MNIGDTRIPNSLWIQNISMSCQDTNIIIITAKLCFNSDYENNVSLSENKVKYNNVVGGGADDGIQWCSVNKFQTIIFRVSSNMCSFWIHHWKFANSRDLYTKKKHTYVDRNTNAIVVMKSALCSHTEYYESFHQNNSPIKYETHSMIHENSKSPNNKILMGRVDYKSDIERLQKIDILDRVIIESSSSSSRQYNWNNNNNGNGNKNSQTIHQSLWNNNWMKFSQFNPMSINDITDGSGDGGGNNSNINGTNDFKSLCKFEMFESKLTLLDNFLQRTKLKLFDIVQFNKNHNKIINLLTSNDGNKTQLIIDIKESELMDYISMKCVDLTMEQRSFNQHDILDYSHHWLNWNLELLKVAAAAQPSIVSKNNDIKKQNDESNNNSISTSPFLNKKMIVWIDVQLPRSHFISDSKVCNQLFTSSGLRNLCVPMWNDEYCDHFKMRSDEMITGIGDNIENEVNTERIMNLYIINEITSEFIVWYHRSDNEFENQLNSRSSNPFEIVGDKLVYSKNEKLIIDNEYNNRLLHQKFEISSDGSVIKCNDKLMKLRCCKKNNESEVLKSFFQYITMLDSESNMPEIIIPVSIHDTSLYNLNMSGSINIRDHYAKLRSTADATRNQNHKIDVDTHLSEPREMLIDDNGDDDDDDDNDNDDDDDIHSSTNKNDVNDDTTGIINSSNGAKKNMEQNTSRTNDYLFSSLHYIFMRLIGKIAYCRQLDTVNDNNNSIPKDIELLYEAMDSLQRNCLVAKTMDQCMFNVLFSECISNSSSSSSSANNLDDKNNNDLRHNNVSFDLNKLYNENNYIFVDMIVDAYQCVIIGKTFNFMNLENLSYQILSRFKKIDSVTYPTKLPNYRPQLIHRNTMNRSDILYLSMLNRKYQSSVFLSKDTKHLWSIKIADRNIKNSNRITTSEYLTNKLSSDTFGNSNNKTSKMRVKGAFVKDSKVGIHTDVILYDFASLYPSIISEYNMCFTTMLQCPPRAIGSSSSSSPLNTMNSNKRKFEIFDDSTGMIDTSGLLYSKNDYYDNANENDMTSNFEFHSRVGYLPTFLKSTLIGREKLKACTKSMNVNKENNKDNEKIVITIQCLGEMEQLVKLSNNCLYGILGSDDKMFSNVAIANEITKMGRRHIMELFDVVRLYTSKNQYSIELDTIYGDTDSVMAKIYWKNQNDTTTKGNTTMTFEEKKIFVTSKISPEICSYFDQRYKYIKLKMDGFFHFVYMINKKCYYVIPTPLDSIKIDVLTESLRSLQSMYCHATHSEFHDAMNKLFVSKYSNWIINKGTPPKKLDTPPIAKLMCCHFLLFLYCTAVKSNDPNKLIHSVASIILDNKKPDTKLIQCYSLDNYVGTYQCYFYPLYDIGTYYSSYSTYFLRKIVTDHDLWHELLSKYEFGTLEYNRQRTIITDIQSIVPEKKRECISFKYTGVNDKELIATKVNIQNVLMKSELKKSFAYLSRHLQIFSLGDPTYASKIHDWINCQLNVHETKMNDC